MKKGEERFAQSPPVVLGSRIPRRSLPDGVALPAAGGSQRFVHDLDRRRTGYPALSRRHAHGRSAPRRSGVRRRLHRLDRQPRVRRQHACCQRTHRERRYRLCAVRHSRQLGEHRGDRYADGRRAGKLVAAINRAGQRTTWDGSRRSICGTQHPVYPTMSCGPSTMLPRGGTVTESEYGRSIHGNASATSVPSPLPRLVPP